MLKTLGIENYVNKLLIMEKSKRGGIFARLIGKLLCRHEWRKVEEDVVYWGFPHADGGRDLKDVHRLWVCEKCGKMFVEDRKFY